jgi:uncharacterized small protein (DUF1192 family)
VKEASLAELDEEAVFGRKPKAPTTHEIGQNVDTLSATELGERIDLLKSEIARLEQAIAARHATRAAADAAFSR